MNRTIPAAKSPSKYISSKILFYSGFCPCTERVMKLQLSPNICLKFLFFFSFVKAYPVLPWSKVIIQNLGLL